MENIIIVHTHKLIGDYHEKMFCAGLFLLILICTACEQVSVSEAETTTGIVRPTETLSQENELPSFSPYSLEISVLLDNPLDVAYRIKKEELDATSGYLLAEINFYKEFNELWTSEMNHALKILRDNLTKEKLNKLDEAQTAWVTYEKKDAELGANLRAEVAEIAGEHGYGVISIRKAFLVQRYRTLQLIEYCCAVVGDYKFIYA